MKSLVIGSKINGKWDADRMAQALLLFRNAPRCGGGASPAEAVFGHPIRDTLPAHPRSFTNQWQRPEEELKERTEAARERSAAFYNRTAHPLTDLSIGDHVLIQDPTNGQWLTAGEVTEVGLNRDYLIKTNNGKVFRRNRRHLLRRVPVLPTPPTSSMEHQLNQPSTYAEAAGGRPNVTVTPIEQGPEAPSLLEQPPTPDLDKTCQQIIQPHLFNSVDEHASVRQHQPHQLFAPAVAGPHPATTPTTPHQSGPSRRRRKKNKGKSRIN